MKNPIKSVTIVVRSVNKCGDGKNSYLDFCISLNGQEPDADLYRIYSWENEFHKILGFTRYGHAVRGNARKIATDLILDMRKNGILVGHASIA